MNKHLLEKARKRKERLRRQQTEKRADYMARLEKKGFVDLSKSLRAMYLVRAIHEKLATI